MASTGAGLPTRSQIEGWDVTHLHAAARRWAATAEVWDQAFEAVHQEALAPGGSDFDGVTAAAIRQRTLADKLVVIRISEDLLVAATAARTGVDAIAAAKSAAVDAITRAEDAGFDVGEDLSLTSRQEFAEAEFDTKLAEAQRLAVEIRTTAASLAQTDAGVASAVTAAVDSFAVTSFAEPAEPGGLARGPVVRPVSNETPRDPSTTEGEGEPKIESVHVEPHDDTSRTLQNLLLPDETSESPDDDAIDADTKQPRDLDEALSTVAGGQPIAAPPSVLDRFKDQMKGSGKDEPRDGAEVPYTESPLAAPIVAADPSVVDDQAARVDAAQQAAAAAQVDLDAAAVQSYAQGPGGGPGRDATDSLSQALFDARRNLTEQTKILEDLDQARVDIGGRPVGIPEFPPNADVQAFPPKPSSFAEGSRALNEGSFGLIPDVAHDIEVFRNWGEHSGADQAGAILDVAGAIPIPGGKAFSEALQQGLDALSTAGRHADDIPSGTHRGGDAPGGHNHVEAQHEGGAAASTDDASQSLVNQPPQAIVGPGGEFLPLVPERATGSVTVTGNGTIYDIPPGTDGLDPRVARVRVMDPTVSGPYKYPSGYVVYENEMGQAVNPLTGRTIRKSDRYWHIPLE